MHNILISLYKYATTGDIVYLNNAKKDIEEKNYKQEYKLKKYMEAIKILEKENNVNRFILCLNNIIDYSNMHMYTIENMALHNLLRMDTDVKEIDELIN
jgi:hypothetical protein